MQGIVKDGADERQNDLYENKCDYKKNDKIRVCKSKFELRKIIYELSF